MEKLENRLLMSRNKYYIIVCVVMLALWGQVLPSWAQWVRRDTTVTVDYTRTPRQVVVKSIVVEGLPNFDQKMLVRLSGISVGDRISVPGSEITRAIKRYWKNGLFSDVSVGVDSIIDDSAYLHINLMTRPRISEVRYNGVKKGDRQDLEAKLGLVKNNQLTPNMIDRAKILAQRYFDEKGYKNAEIEILQQDDPAAPDKVLVTVNIKKNGYLI